MTIVSVLLDDFLEEDKFGNVLGSKFWMACTELSLVICCGVVWISVHIRCVTNRAKLITKITKIGISEQRNGVHRAYNWYDRFHIVFAICVESIVNGWSWYILIKLLFHREASRTHADRDTQIRVQFSGRIVHRQIEFVEAGVRARVHRILQKSQRNTERLTEYKAINRVRTRSYRFGNGLQIELAIPPITRLQCLETLHWQTRTPRREL